jgi:hypothetical protein
MLHAQTHGVRYTVKTQLGGNQGTTKVQGGDTVFITHASLSLYRVGIMLEFAGFKDDVEK